MARVQEGNNGFYIYNDAGERVQGPFDTFEDAQSGYSGQHGPLDTGPASTEAPPPQAPTPYQEGLEQVQGLVNQYGDQFFDPTLRDAALSGLLTGPNSVLSQQQAAASRFGALGGELGALREQFGALGGQFGDIAGSGLVQVDPATGQLTGGDTAFRQAAQAQLAQQQFSQQQQLGSQQTQLSRRGLGGSSAALNAQNQIQTQFGLQQQSLLGQLGAQQLARQDQARAMQGQLLGQQGSLIGQQGQFTAQQAALAGQQAGTFGAAQQAQQNYLSNIGSGITNALAVPTLETGRIAAETAGQQPSGSSGGGGLFGGCCFIFLEARYGDGRMDKVVRRYRDEHMTERNRRGYYKLSEVLVPLMRKSRAVKLLVRVTMTDPLVKYGEWYYNKKGAGWLFAPVKNFWLKLFDALGGDVQYVRENGEVV